MKPARFTFSFLAILCFEALPSPAKPLTFTCRVVSDRGTVPTPDVYQVDTERNWGTVTSDNNVKENLYEVLWGTSTVRFIHKSPAMMGLSLSVPVSGGEISAAHKQQLSADQRKRNEVEGCFGSGKRKYSLDLIVARLPKGAETLISMAFVVMCAEKILRLLRFFFVTVCAWFYAWQWPDALLEVFRSIWQLEMDDSLIAV